MTAKTIWRLDKKRYASEAFRGLGALRSGGRWHRKGTQVAYASEHPDVAALEKLVWLESYEKTAESAYVLLSLRLDPERHLEKLIRAALPEGWDGFPHSTTTKQIGARWLRGALGLFGGTQRRASGGEELPYQSTPPEFF